MELWVAKFITSPITPSSCLWRSMPRCLSSARPTSRRVDWGSSCSPLLRPPPLTALVDSEKAKQKAREEKWQRLRDAAIRNKDSSTPLPASLLDSVAPQGTYNPNRDDEPVDDMSYNDMDEDQLAVRLVGEPEEEQGSRMESDDGHGDLVSLRFFSWGFAFVGTELMRLRKPDQFPETARRQVPGPGGTGSQPHVRRKSVIPLDASILRELASHKSFVLPSFLLPGSCVGADAAFVCSLDDGPLTGPRPGGGAPGRS